ncbi:hypothetical protein A2U01_0100102, partial [Trifolium medium]|nr:hypothetical protein [Trifolium medium]
MNQQAQPAVVETTAPPVLTSQGGSSVQNTAWPLYGLAIGYTPSGYMHPSNEGSAAAQVIQVPMGTNNE